VKDLKTLLSSDATDFERQLLGAAAGERPSPALQLRMQQAIGLGPVALQGPEPGRDASIGGPEVSGPRLAVKAATSKWAGGTWLKVVLGVGAAGFVAGGLALRSREPAPLTRAPTPTGTPVPERPALLAPEAAPVEAAPVEAATPNAPSAATSPEVSRELREEIDLLDRVRTALNQRDARAASTLLESYTTRFPEGRLAREATVLRARTAQVARTAR
jgi:hypothetical protein